MFRASIHIGSDPELFLKSEGHIIGSERLIPKAGLINTGYYSPSIVRDGVQLELHPTATHDRLHQLQSVAGCMGLLKKRLLNMPNIEACFSGLVEVSKKELTSLDPTSQILGCQPSLNYYGIKPLNVDPVRYRKRSAGGHIHVGLPNSFMDDRIRLVPMFDVMVGNTGVLLDRDPAQLERRKLYGRVGEYRLPRHGIEYRTLSNFWLRSPVLAHLMFGLAQESVDVLSTTLNTKDDLEHELLSKVNFKKLIKGIQTNSAELAWETWEVFKTFTAKYNDASSPITLTNLPKVEKLFHRVQKEGLATVFPVDPFKSWENPLNNLWNTFLESI